VSTGSVVPATALDTSVIISGVLSWHEHHQAASAALLNLLESRSEIVLPLHTLVESYSVMTRLPPPHRVSSRDAVDILEGSFRDRSTLIGLAGNEGWDLIKNLDHSSITGGMSYDGLILACAMKGGAQRLLTFNRAHFERIRNKGIEIVVPGQ
jgi:Predicted nucleic acid-binding protein, contains PIN domain